MKPKLDPTHPPIQKTTNGWVLMQTTTVTRLNGKTFKIYKGYEFDGHTIPWPVNKIFTQGGKDIYAALVHDFMYQYREPLPPTISGRREADKTYDLLMSDPLYRHNGWRATIMPAMVNLVGMFFWYWGKE
jgi:hypothetical protein